MNPFILASTFTLLSPSGGEMPSAFSPEAKLNTGSQIEQQQLVEGNQQQDIISLIDKEVGNDQLAVNLPVQSPVFASLPQPERTSATLAVYRSNDESSTLHLGRTSEIATSIDYPVPTPRTPSDEDGWGDDGYGA